MEVSISDRIKEVVEETSVETIPSQQVIIILNL